MSSGPPRPLSPERLGDHAGRLQRAAWALCADPHDAEDLVQETYARVLARPRVLRAGDDAGYLLRALRNTHLSRLRHDRRRAVEVPLSDAARTAAFDVRAPETAFAVTELLSAIAELPPAAEEVLLAVDVVGLSYREAAVLLGIKEATVTTRLHRARRRVVSAVAPPEPAAAAADYPSRSCTWRVRAFPGAANESTTASPVRRPAIASQ